MFRQAIPPTYPPQATAKKGMPVLAWVGIGCGGLLLLGLGAAVYVFILAKNKIDEFAANPEKAAAAMIVSMHPELKMLSQDEVNGTMTLRTPNGEEMTLSYKDIQDGKFIVTDKDGNTTRIGSADLSQVPTWVPKAPDLTEGISVFHSEVGGKVSGQFSGKSITKAEDLNKYFEEQANAAGFTNFSRKSLNTSATNIYTLAMGADTGKSLNIVITEKVGGATHVDTNYSEKK